MLSRLCFFILSAAVFVSASAEEIRIAASDLLADFISAPLHAYGDEQAIDFKIHNIGSLPALERLRADEIDMAIIAVPANTEVPREAFRTYPFAYDVAVVAVNDRNPLDEISIGALGGIFGSNEEFNYNSWGDLNLSDWGHRTIKPLAAVIDNSITLELFKFSVLREGQMKASVVAVPDSEVEGLLISDASSIAILSRLPKSKKVKALMISSESNGPAFGPTNENVHYGDYPIRLAFHIIYHERNHAAVDKVLPILFSDEIAKALRSNHFFALPDAVRRQLTSSHVK